MCSSDLGALVGCQGSGQIKGEAQAKAARPGARAVDVQFNPSWLHTQPGQNAAYNDIWDRMRDGFQLQDAISTNPRIERQRLWFLSNQSFLEQSSARGSLYMHYVVERLEERNMPLELALLPVIESAYNPFALSRSNAAGLWQFIPATGQHFNLRQTNFYDGRRDITASTNAALTYLERLHDMFNGDWMLALAAYNAGEGTVSRAIERNEKLGLPTDYWNLPLPQETQDYVPKLLALSQIVMAPDSYGISLNPINNRLSSNHLRKGQQLSIPGQIAGGAVKPVYQQLARQASTPARTRSYKVKNGDSLWQIARNNGVDVNDLKRWNGLDKHALKVGQTLKLQGGPQALAARKGNAAGKRDSATYYKVKQGDSMYLIAKRFNVEMKHLQRWNPRSKQALKPGQTLTLYLDTASR